MRIILFSNRATQLCSSRESAILALYLRKCDYIFLNYLFFSYLTSAASAAVRERASAAPPAERQAAAERGVAARRAHGSVRVGAAGTLRRWRFRRGAQYMFHPTSSEYFQSTFCFTTKK